jgi:osmoprotectant transport system ATP-binding protein
MIEFQNVSKSYEGTTVIDGLNLSIGKGEFVVLIGASGSGKSTTLKMINRMEGHDAGRILFNGEEIYKIELRQLRLSMGYAIQSVGLFPHWTVERNIETVPKMLGWNRKKIDARVTELLELFHLDPVRFRHRYPHQLSGGQQQRVGVARALAADPSVLLMDEPFGALDPVTRHSLQLEMKRVHQVSGKTIVLVTHDIDEALMLATKIVLLDHGKIIQVASPLELLSQPRNDFVRDFIGRANRGIKLLSLQQAQSLARSDIQEEGLSLPGHASLREALSLMTVEHVDRLNLTGSDGRPTGVLHAADVFRARQVQADLTGTQ